MEGCTVTEFPSWVLQPRTETGARQFLAKYPEYDGRGTIIAILDSGVDPGAGGMQVTTDGRVKVIERIDASGAGDVVMSKEVEPKDGYLEGLTGRKLRLTTGLENPSGRFRLGVKRAYNIYPKPLKDRMVKERLEKLWDPSHKLNVAMTVKKQQELEAKNEAAGIKELYGLEKLTKEELDAQLDVLTSTNKKIRSESASLGDVGPIYDIVSFFDGELWNVLIDTSEEGDLTTAIHLRPYAQTHEFASLCDSSKLNVSVNVYDDGDVVQIVSMCSGHGTHVASIAAANFPDAPEKNGLAPGAQIISITIGDGRLGSMETGTALARACTYIMQRQSDPKLANIDVINMSYGEHSHWSNTGRIGELMHEVIDNYGVVWVVSASNDGPALCTMGTPPDICTNSCIGVGAYVSPEMMLALYSANEKLPATPYTWSSRGPTQDGDRGVTVCAPGGAITSVPHYTLKSTQLMNGTSMASPHVCGAVSLLLSGMKAKHLATSPFSVKRALSVTAKHLPHLCHYAQGHGLLQIENAFEHLCRFSESVERDVRFAITCGATAKGIHLRGANKEKQTEVPVKIEPIFLDADKVSADRKIAFEMELALTCPDSWVKYPDHLALMYSSRAINVKIDPSGLESGVHSSYIKAFDVKQPDKGMLFEIPITVVKREPLDLESPRPTVNYQHSFQPGGIRRHFYCVPDKCTYAVVRVNSNEKVGQGKFVLHTIQLLPKKDVRTLEHYKMFTLSDNGEFNFSFRVKEGVIIEVCLAKWWANEGLTNVSYTISFSGVLPDPKEIVLHGAEHIARVDLISRSQSKVQPEIKLTTSVQNYRPVESKVIPLGPRDVIPVNRVIYELQVSYNFNIAKATEVTPHFPLLSDLLYESEFESQLWLLYNSRKQFIASGDAYSDKWSTKVEKDDYVIRAHVRSERREILEKMLDLPLVLYVKLCSPVSLDTYTSFASASTNGKKASSFIISAGSTVPLYIANPAGSDKLTKNAMLGTYLKGSMSLHEEEQVKKADVYTVKYFLNEPSKRDKNGGKKAGGSGGSSSGSSNSGSNSSSKSPEASFKEAVNDQKISWLSKLDPASAECLELLSELTSSSSKADQIQVRMAKLQGLELDKKLSLDNVTTARAEEALKLTDFVLGEINETDLLAHAAIKQDNRSDAADIKKDMDKKKNYYLDALAKRGIALCSLDRTEEATEVLFRALKLVDMNDPKLTFFAAVHAQRLGHFGRALKLIQSLMDAKAPTMDMEQRVADIYEQLGWQHCHLFLTKSLPVKYPNDYEPF